MTEEQKDARRLSAASGHIKWIRDNCLRTKDSGEGENYVFISYKSDDYKQALDDILYRTCRKYGLRVYFDVAFDDGADSWIKQFYANMCDTKCKAMIAFISSEYYSSYATLMEMMARKTCGAGGDYVFDTLRLITINLKPLEPPSNGGANTGLGTARFLNDDGSARENSQAPEELKQFNEIFEELLIEDKRLKSLYKGYRKTKLYKEAIPKLDLPKEGDIFLTVNQCRMIMQNVFPPHIEADGSSKAFEDAIHDKLVNAGLGSVFIPNWKPLPPDDTEPPKPPKPEPPKPEMQTISLPAFLQKYNFKTFLKNTYKEFRLVGEGECAKYTTVYFNSSAKLTQSFLRTVLAEQGEAYILRVLEKENGRTNPSFIPRQEMKKKSVQYQKLNIPGLENWAMCSNYGQYGWINDVLRRRIEDLGLPLSSFSLEYIPNSENPEPMDNIEVDYNGEEPETTGGEGETGTTGGGETGTTGGGETGTTGGGETGTGRGIDGTVTLGGMKGSKGGKKKNVKPRNGYNFTIFGEDHTQQSQKNVMLTVFKAVIDRHPDKLDELVERLPCLKWGSVIGDKTAGVTTTFRNGGAHTVDGREFSIGTSLNSEQAFGYIKQLLQICGEPENCLNVYQKPD